MTLSSNSFYQRDGFLAAQMINVNANANIIKANLKTVQTSFCSKCYDDDANSLRRNTFCKQGNYFISVKSVSDPL